VGTLHATTATDMSIRCEMCHSCSTLLGKLDGYFWVRLTLSGGVLVRGSEGGNNWKEEGFFLVENR